MELPNAELTPAVSAVEQEVFLPTTDVTVTVDPINREHWIYDGSGFDAHKRSVQRGLQFDRTAFNKTLKWYEASHGAVSLFQPTVAMIDTMDKFAMPIGSDCQGWAGYKRDPSRFGKLPVIKQALYDGKYINKSKGEIEHEMREADRLAAGRLFDQSGYTR